MPLLSLLLLPVGCLMNGLIHQLSPESSSIHYSQIRAVLSSVCPWLVLCGVCMCVHLYVLGENIVLAS